MNYYWITTDLSSRALSKIFSDNDIFVVSDEALEILVTAAPVVGEKIQQLIWDESPSSYCEVKEASYEEAEQYM